jgi:hypothetical protein
MSALSSTFRAYSSVHLEERAISVMAGAPKGLWTVFTRLFKTFAWLLFLRQKFTFFMAKMNREDDLTTLCGFIKAGKVTPVIDRRYRQQKPPVTSLT